MKQRAYTLAEVIIAVGIIGVLAAILLPMANKFKPDTTKVLYLNTYDALSKTINTMANNNDYYPETNGTFSFRDFPFANLDNYTDRINRNLQLGGGRNKFCRVLAEGLSILEERNQIACNDEYTPYDENGFIRSFTGKNGVEFMVTTNTAASTNAMSLQQTNEYQTDIIIDINGNDGNNCVFSNACQSPDRFTFKVSADATLLPTDEMGIRYLETRSTLRYKKLEDYDNNSQLATDIEDQLERNNLPFDPFALLPGTPGANNAPEEEEVTPPDEGDDNSDDNSGDDGGDGGNGENIDPIIHDPINGGGTERPGTQPHEIDNGGFNCPPGQTGNLQGKCTGGKIYH